MSLWWCKLSAQQGNVFCALLVTNQVGQKSWMQTLAPMKSLLGESLGSKDPCHRTESPQLVSSAGRRLLNRENAAKGSRQTGHVPSEDVVAPEAKFQGPAAGFV
jgi:hypothetical protein